MTELNELNPSDAALNAEPTENTNTEVNPTESPMEMATTDLIETLPIAETTETTEVAASHEAENEVTPLVAAADATESIENTSPVTEAQTSVEQNNPNENPIANLNMATDAIEINIDEHDNDFAAIEMVEQHESIHYASKSKDELLAIATEATKDKVPSEALQIFKDVKPYFDAALQEEQELALQKFVEEGGDKNDFEFKSGMVARDKFNKAIKDLRDKIATAKAIAEAERLKNLQAKEAILERIKTLNSLEETKDSLAKLKELQSEWKLIKNVPKEHVERLWESYRVLNEIFYDKLSINNEIAQLDRERNLDAKIDLCKKVSELSEEKSIKSALIAVKKYQEEWRNIGPVPKEANEDIWTRFKGEVDKVFAYIKLETEKNEAVRQENLKLKYDLIEKAKELALFNTTRIKEWMEKTKVANELMEEWKKIGYVPLADREKVWEEFKNIRNTFFNNKNTWFKSFNAVRNENLKKKHELIKEAENIAAAPIDWGKQTAQVKGLQESWKQIGPVPDKFNDDVWKKFRAACDLFFEKKAEKFADQNAEQGNNLIAKKELLVKLEAMAADETENANLFNELKTLQDAWSKIGFVPNKDKDAITKQYNALLDKIYGKHREARKNMRQADDKSHFESLANNPDGAQRLQREERILLERIKGLKADMDTWDNNLGFFKNANSKNEMVMQIHDKIAAAKRMIAELNEKVKTIRNLKNQTTGTTAE